MNEFMPSKKNIYIYLAIVVLGGAFGVHWFVRRKPLKGVIYLFTAGLFFIGWFMDIGEAIRYIMGYNEMEKRIKTQNIQPKPKTKNETFNVDDELAKLKYENDLESKKYKLQNIREKLASYENDEDKFTLTRIDESIRIIDMKLEHEKQYFFDVYTLKKKDGSESYYFLTIDYFNKVKDDMEYFNKIINEFNEKEYESCYPIRWYKIDINNTDFDTISLHFKPFTKTGKDKKKPFTVMFDINNAGRLQETHGFLEYSRNGTLLSGRLHCHTLKMDIISFYFDYIDGAFFLKKIKKNNSYVYDLLENKNATSA